MLVNMDRVGQLLTTMLAVSSTPTPLASAGVLDGSRCGRHTVEIANTGTADVYIGGSDVTTKTGIPVKAGESKLMPVNHTSVDNLYIVGSGTVILGEYFR